MSESILHIGNVRTALEWCFSAGGDRAAGARLAAYAAPLLLNMFQLEECRHWCEQGLAALSDAQRGTPMELALQEAAAVSTMLTAGNSDGLRAVIEHALILSEILGEVPHRLRLMAGLNIFLTRTGNFREALAVAERCAAIAREAAVPGANAIAYWMLGCSNHFAGNQDAARRQLESGFRTAADEKLGRADVFGFDHRTRASAAQGRVLWLAGHPDQALKIARQPIDETEKIYHPVNACVTMLSSAQVLMWCGFLDEAQQRVERMVAHAARHSLHTSHAIALALEGELAVARGQPDVGVDLLQPALHTLSTERHFLLATYFLRALAEGLLQCGQVDAALVKIDEAMARAEAQGDTFDKPELMRVRACILLAMEPGDTMAAGQLLAAALAHARSQAAHGLELRTAITLASLWRSHHRDDDARRLLTGVYMRFTEGYETADLKTAAALLDELGRL